MESIFIALIAVFIAWVIHKKKSDEFEAKYRAWCNERDHGTKSTILTDAERDWFRKEDRKIGHPNA